MIVSQINANNNRTRFTVAGATNRLAFVKANVPNVQQRIVSIAAMYPAD